ncbi:MAG TPA: hypothetical protein VIV61_03570 [Candidatus Ozemobacteraceae bacterium]
MEEHPTLPASPSGTVWIVLASLALLCVMAIPLVHGEIPSRDDLGALHYPLRVFYGECLARGLPFDWMPTLFGGCFITGEGELGAYHPFHLLIYRLFSPATAFQIELLAGYPFLLAGMVLFLRPLVKRSDAAWFGALAFTFSAFTMLHFVHPHLVAVTAHIPWLLAAIRAIGTRTGPSRLVPEAGLALLTASQLLLGHPPTVWLSLLAEGAWAVFIYRLEYNKHLRFLMLKAVGLLIGSLQLLPTWDVLQESGRNQPTTEFLMSGSWHPINLFQLVAPYLVPNRVLGYEPHEFALYVGAVPLVLGTWYILTHLRRTGPADGDTMSPASAGPGLLPFLATALLVSLILACGSYGGLALLQTWVPLVGKFRVPARALLLVHLAWAVIAAQAWSALTSSDGESKARSLRRVTWLLTGFSIATTAGLPFVLGTAVPTASLAGAAAGPFLIAAAGLICQGIARGASWAVPVAILFTALDLGCYGISYAVFSPEPPAIQRLLANVPAHAAGERLAAIPRTFGNTGRSGVGNRFLLRGFSQIDGYLALEPRNRLFGTAASLPALRVAGVRWIPALASPPQALGLAAHAPGWWEVPAPLLRLRLVSNAVSSLHPDQDIGSIDIETTALTDTPVALEPGVPGVATILAESPGRLLVRTTAPATRLAVLADRHHPGWKVFQEEQAVPSCRVNGDFLGWQVPAGTHTFRLEFRPASLTCGWIGSLLGLVLLLLYGLTVIIRRPECPSPVPNRV